jgi:hypothetical protein
MASAFRHVWRRIRGHVWRHDAYSRRKFARLFLQTGGHINEPCGNVRVGRCSRHFEQCYRRSASMNTIFVHGY